MVDASLFEPKNFGVGDLAYGATFIVPQGHPQLAEIRGAIVTAATMGWGKTAPDILARLNADKKVAWVEDPGPKRTGNVDDGVEGAFHLYTRNGGQAPVKPVVLDAENCPVTKADGIDVVGGYVDASVEFFAKDNDVGPIIDCELRGVRTAVSKSTKR